MAQSQIAVTGNLQLKGTWTVRTYESVNSKESMHLERRISARIGVPIEGEPPFHRPSVSRDIGASGSQLHGEGGNEHGSTKAPDGGTTGGQPGRQGSRRTNAPERSASKEDADDGEGGDERMSKDAAKRGLHDASESGDPNEQVERSGRTGRGRWHKEAQEEIKINPDNPTVEGRTRRERRGLEQTRASLSASEPEKQPQNQGKRTLDPCK